MAIFKKPRGRPEPEAEDPLPVSPLDFSKRYDIYCVYIEEERVYENMRIVALRTMEKPRAFGSSVIGGYIELEDPDGKRVLVPHLHIHMLCEHGQAPDTSFSARECGPKPRSKMAANKSRRDRRVGSQYR